MMIMPRPLALALGLLLAVGPSAYAAEPAGDEIAAADTASEALPLDELRTFAEVFGRIKTDYVESVADGELLESAIRGMLAGLDPHSAYLDAEEYRDLRVGTSGEFGGLGIEVGMENGFVKVIAPIDDTPAQRAGLRAGDLIVRIDHKPVKGMSLNDAVELMRGEPGTEVVLMLMREGEEAPLELTLERAVIQVESVRSRVLEPGYGYVRIAHFQSRTAEDMTAAIETLKAGETPLAGLVLDLRNNPGGVLNSAVGVSDAFLTGGLIVYTQGRDPSSRLDFKAGPDDVLDGAPLVVLVNGGSASASEIVAGALQDQRRAIVMGAQTFGKGSVQTIVPVDDETALKLTTARYYTPSGRSIQAQGISPDILLERGEFRPLAGASVEPLKEADLVRHLDDPDGDGTVPVEADEPAEAATTESLDAEVEPTPLRARDDYQLLEALNVLKGVNILGRSRAD
ncbi:MULTISPECIES: S41 family peptidase [unclassified Marichromatium]|uniref:S41 family peptidase n=1 Tax=unclassified Marichromatium TaxID=2618417 RepID=UPI000F3E7905|nr:S41 family peptidase [Marichromatium sp. AB32]RNE92932.1 S41 family peptidase [Marichromatium sp. AB32]